MGFKIQNAKPTLFEVNEKSEIWNADLTFIKGKSYLIHASSGKGKSSFFKMLCALNSDYSGQISFEEQDLKKVNISKLSDFRKNKWSLVFQDLALFLHLKAFENLVTPIPENTYDLICDLGMQDKMENQVATLSYGERQRLAIIRALSKPYDFLIMDEPFSHLDKSLRTIAWNHIIEDVKNKNGALILLDLHDNPEFKVDYRMAL